MPTISLKVQYRKLGGHVHVDFFMSEFGPETTHGKNGSLIFRLTEWPTFKERLESGHGGFIQLVDMTTDDEKGR